MNYKENMQHEELKRILPRLMQCLEKRKKLARLNDSIISQKHLLFKRKELLEKLQEIPELLQKQGIEYNGIKEALSRKISDISLEVQNMELNLEKREMNYKEILEEIKAEESYYMGLRNFLRNIKITKEHVDLKEFEALLYFMWMTGATSQELFEDFSQMYPQLTTIVNKIRSTKNFSEAEFEEIFDIWK